MELVKNIFFNTDRLVANNTIKLSYSGLLFQKGSTKVYIKYCFGDDWESFTQAEMTKTELGFQIEIQLQDKGTLNFCMKNEKNEWDNNNGINYIFEIEPVEVETPEQSETSLLVVDNSENSIRRVRRTYMWSKKVKLAIYKMLIYIPKLITGNYKRKTEEF